MANQDLISTLTGNAKAVAQWLDTNCVGVVITSAKRDLKSQAHAMATNVIKNGLWIQDTYAKSTVRDACQTWVNNNVRPDIEVDEITNGLFSVLQSFNAEDLHHLSFHLVGQAFDLEPNDSLQSYIQDIINAHNSAGGVSKFLTSEGGLRIFHIQMSNTPPIELE